MDDSPPSEAAAQEAPEELPLWEAALAWCDPVLVQALMDARSEYGRMSGAAPRDNPFPMPFEQGQIATLVVTHLVGVATGPEKPAATNWLATARAVTEQFRSRIAAGEITLTGLQTKPHLERKRSVVPPSLGRAVEVRMDQEQRESERC
jgi:hypothetical protein